MVLNVINNLILYWWCFPEDVLRISSNSFPRESFSCLNKVSLAYYSHQQSPPLWWWLEDHRKLGRSLLWVWTGSWGQAGLICLCIFPLSSWNLSSTLPDPVATILLLCAPSCPFCLHSSPSLLLHPPNLGSAVALNVIYTASHPCGISHSVNGKDNHRFW